MKTSRFTSHIYPSSAGSCLISIWLGATHPAAPLWPRKLETSTFGKNIPTFRASPRSFLQVSGIHLKPDFWEVCINSTRFSTEEKRAIYFVLKYKWQMILVLLGKKKGMWRIVTFSKDASFAKYVVFVFHVAYEVLGHQDQWCLLDSQVNIQDMKKINNPPSFLIFFFFLRSYVKLVEATVSGCFRILGQQWSSVLRNFLTVSHLFVLNASQVQVIPKRSCVLSIFHMNFHIHNT